MTCCRCRCCPCRCTYYPPPPPVVVIPKLPCGCQVNCCTCTPIIPPGGCYYIKCKATDTYVCNSGGCKTSGNPIIGCRTYNTDYMKWKLLLASGSKTEYYFENIATGMYMGANTSLGGGARVPMTLQNNAIYFTIMRVYADTYIFNVRGQAAYCIDLDNANSADGTSLGWCKWSANTCQQFFLESCDSSLKPIATPKPKPVSNTNSGSEQGAFPKPFVNPNAKSPEKSCPVTPGCYFVKCVATNTTINNRGWGNNPGNPILGWRQVEQNNSKWHLTLKSGSTTEYYLANAANNMPIGYSGSLTGSGVKATLQNNPVYFTIKDMGGGKYMFHVTGTKYVFDVAGSSKDNGASILLFPAHNGPNQQWTLEATEPN